MKTQIFKDISGFLSFLNVNTFCEYLNERNIFVYGYLAVSGSVW